MITDPHSGRSFKQPSFESDSALFEVAFTTLYADVKEPAGLLQPLRAVPRTFGLLSLPHLLKQKTVVSLLHFSPLFLSLPLAFPLPMVGVAGFEPATLRLSSACSNQLSYTPAHC